MFLTKKQAATRPGYHRYRVPVGYGDGSAAAAGTTRLIPAAMAAAAAAGGSCGECLEPLRTCRVCSPVLPRMALCPPSDACRTSDSSSKRVVGWLPSLSRKAGSNAATRRLESNRPL